MFNELMDKVDVTDDTVKLAVLSFGVLGAYKVLSSALGTLSSLMKYFVMPRRDLAGRYGAGSWALITGASDGLGKQYALELAREGFNIILMGRNKEKTDLAAEEVRKAAPGISTKVLIYDFAKLETEESANELKALIDAVKEDISILANNAGVLHFGRLGDRSLESINGMINVNVNAQTYMSMFVIPRLLKREKRSAVINLSSKAAFYSRANMPMYCATKRYNFALSRCMQDAYKDRIDVMTVTPASVKSGMNPGTGVYTITAEEHAKGVIDHLGRYG